MVLCSNNISKNRLENLLVRFHSEMVS